MKKKVLIKSLAIVGVLGLVLGALLPTLTAF